MARLSRATCHISDTGRPATRATAAPVWTAGIRAATSWKLLGMGVVASNTSSWRSPRRSAMHDVARVTSAERSTTPLGRPVVPEV